MAIALYMDVHIPQAVTDQLRRRGIDVLTAFEDECQELPDDQLLLRVTQLNRVLFTQDIRFRVLAETWQVEGKPFSGLIFGHQLSPANAEVIDYFIWLDGSMSPPNGTQDTTRRVWKPRTLAAWQKAWDEGRLIHDAVDRNLAYGGKRGAINQCD